MKGLELSESYFKTYGLPLIQEKFGRYADRIAAGLVGDGSECFGFDDKISQDHDWGPGFNVWLLQEDFDKFGSALLAEISKLPLSFKGYGPRLVSDWGEGRVGVSEMSQFFLKFTGIDHVPKSLEEWLFIPESFLATVTNGKVFYDPLGKFTTWRNSLLAFYPEDVRLKKIAARCMTIAQSGQYNFSRSVKRDEYLAAQYAETKFCADVISLIFLLNKKYVPYHKWMHRAVAKLPVLGQEIYSKIDRLIACHDYNKKSLIIEDICALILKEFIDEGLSDCPNDFLLYHGPVIQKKIKDPLIREKNVWIG